MQIIIISIFSAIIKPEGRRVTMSFVSLLMIALYVSGLVAIRGNEMSVIVR